MQGTGRLVSLFCWLGTNARFTNQEMTLKDKYGVDRIIVKKQSYQLLSTNREFFPNCDVSNFHFSPTSVFISLPKMSSPICILYECLNV